MTKDHDHKRGVVNSRKSFVFNEDASKRLERLRKTSRLDTDTAVVRVALEVFEELVEATVNEGGSIFIRLKSGQCRRWHPLFQISIEDSEVDPPGEKIDFADETPRAA